MDTYKSREKIFRRKTSNGGKNGVGERGRVIDLTVRVCDSSCISRTYFLSCIFTFIFEAGFYYFAKAKYIDLVVEANFPSLLYVAFHLFLWLTNHTPPRFLVIFPTFNLQLYPPLLSPDLSCVPFTRLPFFIPEFSSSELRLSGLESKKFDWSELVSDRKSLGSSQSSICFLKT